LKEHILSSHGSRVNKINKIELMILLGR
jgi:hypothetical protein